MVTAPERTAFLTSMAPMASTASTAPMASTASTGLWDRARAGFGYRGYTGCLPVDELVVTGVVVAGSARGCTLVEGLERAGRLAASVCHDGGYGSCRTGERVEPVAPVRSHRRHVVRRRPLAALEAPTAEARSLLVSLSMGRWSWGERTAACRGRPVLAVLGTRATDEPWLSAAGLLLSRAD